MGTNYGERFSNENYLTNNQVSRTLGTSLIDDIWKDILSYRAQFSSEIKFRSYEKRRFSVVLTPKISDRINQLERRMSRVQSRLHELEAIEDRLIIFKTLQYGEILHTIGLYYGIKFDDFIVNQLINNNISVLSPQEMFLNDYYHGLEFIKRPVTGPLSEATLAQISALFTSPPLNNYIYRMSEIKGSKTQLSNATYFPAIQIRDVIADFFVFLNDNTLPTMVQSAAIIFFLDYIKPFETHSEIISILFCKAFLYRNEFTSLAPYLNLESLIQRYKERYEEVSNEVKKTTDITYFLDLLMLTVNDSLDVIENNISEAMTRDIISEQFQIDEVPTQVSEPQSLFDHAANETIKQTMYSGFTHKVHETSPKSEPLIISGEPTVTVEQANVAFDEIPKELSESDILKLEKHLRETDPSLSRNECYFYARHCTMGRYYTINDFKEQLATAYETARTSMDHLANSGYYRKEKFKNKYIYTPNKKV